MNANLRGTYNVTRAAMPHLEEGAAIVNTSSVMGVTVAANYAIYCATKFAIVGFTKAMAMELGTKQVRCNAIAVGRLPFTQRTRLLISICCVCLARLYQHAHKCRRARWTGSGSGAGEEDRHGPHGHGR